METVIDDLEDVGIPRRTFLHDRSLKRGSATDIPSGRLMKYAKYFDVSIEKLFNYDTKVKSAKERNPSPAMKAIMKRTKLKK